MMVAPKNIWPESYTISISLNFSRFVCEIDICDLKYMACKRNQIYYSILSTSNSKQLKQILPTM